MYTLNVTVNIIIICLDILPHCCLNNTRLSFLPLDKETNVDMFYLHKIIYNCLQTAFVTADRVEDALKMHTAAANRRCVYCRTHLLQALNNRPITTLHHRFSL